VCVCDNYTYINGDLFNVRVSSTEINDQYWSYTHSWDCEDRDWQPRTVKDSTLGVIFSYVTDCRIEKD
jgi:hypothetical protein